MNAMHLGRLACVALVLAVAGDGFRSARGQDAAGRDEPRPASGGVRPAWTTSRVRGSPEPPPPYVAERAFPRLAFNKPVELVAAPGSNRLFVAEQGGKIFSFPNDPDCQRADLAADLRAGIRGLQHVYSLTFHPRFAENRHAYACYVMGDKKPTGTHVSRFTVTRDDPPRLDPASEQVIIEWYSGGHNGCAVRFGPDGCLYISTGDGTNPNPPDEFTTGQNLDDLLSCILRIDVDRPSGDRPYSIPADNPFVDVPGARGEIWAYGFRNPWRMSFDPATGDLWVGDVGWELWEMIYRVERGGNYGWSVMEGRQPARPDSPRGPTPILPPTVDHPHTEGASITGGYVYRGGRLPELAGDYVYGDYETGRMWAFRHEGGQVTRRRELASTRLRIVSFGEDHEGEIYLVDYAGTLQRLVPNSAPAARHEFPRTLSATGLFESVAGHLPAAGVLPFDVNVELWADHATAERFIAVPGRQTIAADSDFREFPADTVLAKTLSLEMERGRADTRRRVETQILHHDGTAWQGYTYAWNDDQTDAVLVDAAGSQKTLAIADAAAPGGKRQYPWRFASRAECGMCHNVRAGYRLAFTVGQLNRQRGDGPAADNQLLALWTSGLLAPAQKEARPVPFDPTAALPEWPRLVPPHDASADVESRARSYLHVQCAHCHRFGGGGTATIELRHELPLEKTRTVGARPAQGTFQMLDARVIAPGDPYRSTLLYRMAKTGPGRMPYIGSSLPDEAGLALVEEWIRRMPPPAEATPVESAAALGRREAGDVARLAGSGSAGSGSAGSGPSDAAAILGRLLGSTSGAMRLARAVAEGKINGAIRDELLARSSEHPEAHVRDLFEQFLPEDRRAKRLGNVVRPEEILALAGDAERGRRLFLNTEGVQCRNCHRLGGQEVAPGPDLARIGGKLDRAALLESILDPSRSIDPGFVVYQVETADGRVLAGLVVSKSETELVLLDARNKEVRLAMKDVERFAPQSKSLMPELLLREMSAQQVADLLEFLGTLK
jgi:uncharacterized repeat protein (TIGR03806 family)